MQNKSNVDCFGGAYMTHLTPIIETINLTKFYGSSRGIEDVNLSVEEGEIFGFIGPNGSGKSTTVRTLLGLLKKTSGEARIFGLDCETQYQTILKDVGYLPSEVFYYDNMRARDLLNYSASFYESDHSRRIKELSERLNLDLSKKIEDMSLGNKKKVGIIQGLLHSPKVIMLDEPTSGLDPLMQGIFFDLIKEENQRGATVLFSSHILSEVQKLCDRVGIIKDGTIIETTVISTLLANTYKRVTLRFIDETAALSAPSISGATNVERDNSEITFIYRGDCNKLITELSAITLLDVEISEPTLEEIFLHYYT